MKKLMKKISFAMVGIMASVPAMAAVNYNNVLCKLATEFNGIFNLLRTLAFIGAGMSIAGWAWGYIKAGKIDDIQKEVTSKGVALLVGFVLLFSIGTVLSVFMSMAGQGGSLGCVQQFFE
ncbi:MAG: hypothetical protein IKJ62_04415 [Alphaproteobacteria bacterium]|nr:hypothetical protein [Alphaproteobacteria bacterium]